MNTCKIAGPKTNIRPFDIKSLLFGGPPKCFMALFHWEERARSRIALSRLAEDHPGRLADIGLTQAQVAAELAKPFWQR